MSWGPAPLLWAPNLAAVGPDTSAVTVTVIGRSVPESTLARNGTLCSDVMPRRPDCPLEPTSERISVWMSSIATAPKRSARLRTASADRLRSDAAIFAVSTVIVKLMATPP